MTEIRNDVMDEEDFDTILSSDIEFSGTLIFTKPFLIKGRVMGEIDATGYLVIAEGAVVEANVRAPSVIIRGSVRGNVFATDRVEIAVSGSLVGDIAAPEILMEKGCVFNGSCAMTKRTKAG